MVFRLDPRRAAGLRRRHHQCDVAGAEGLSGGRGRPMTRAAAPCPPPRGRTGTSAAAA
ncbi:Hypothetical protein I596_840 [Dokdonella koreensis DS-123]|uniref:Uncharacterized protein n=1 Tax=Dokdonella koreensis DS-123 TaxID=1300342 RepID=A0A167GNS9_9GAMM|nr:Hypothetical protein I596_840 [Dokdonella koreensis DS-123]